MNPVGEPVAADAIRAVLFDLDDTLTDRLATVRAYAQRFVADFAALFRLNDVAALADEIARIDHHGYNHDRSVDLAAHAAWISSPGAAALEAHWTHHFAACSQPREGLAVTMDALARAGFRLGVVSNGRTRKQRHKIEVLQLGERLDVVLISEDFGAAKPDATIFRAAADRLGLTPRQCVFVGDNPEKDVFGSAAVGMRAVWFRGALPWPGDRPAASESIASLPEVLALPGLDLHSS